jgi:sec-independent protein translocase protein TatB
MGISGMELMVIALVTLILFGPKELPEVIRTAARALRFLRRSAQDFQSQVDQFVRDSEVNAVRGKVEDAIRHTDEAPLPKRSARLSGTSISSPLTPHLEKPAGAPPATAARSKDPPKADGICR